MRRLVLIALTLLTTLSACVGTTFHETSRESFHQSIAAPAAPTVHVDNVAGTIRIEGWDKSSVAVQATKYGESPEDLRNLAIDVRRDGSNIFIETKYNAAGIHGGGVRYRISVPQSASLVINNVAGTTDVSGVMGNLSVDTKSGTVDAQAGKVDGNRSIDLNATTGTVRLSISRDSSARVDAHSTVGDFSSDFPSVTSSRQNLVGVSAQGKIGSGSAMVRLTTTTGAISLREHS